MTDETLDDPRYEKYREAGDILSTVMNEASERVEVGASQLEVAEFAEERIRELGGECAFPVNISVDEEASHATPARDDDTEFGEEMVCLDVGVHVDGWIADAATTIDLTDTPDLVAAAEEALDAAVDTIAAGVHTGEVGRAIEDAVRGRGYTPILNLSGHGVDQYDAHTGPSVPNRGVDTGIELEVGDVLAVEPFATTGQGKVGEGNDAQIYELSGSGGRSVRNRQARQLLEDIEADFGQLPFAVRWLDDDRAEMLLRRLERQGVVEGHPVLKEDDGVLVSQAEHTLIVTEDGCEVTTEGIF
ncbi:type II methionyl aminopeptidase [Halorussus litoreus]|uniref:type II methionyl aminopeptidase n=1 Tax=Halorussus litoreus TaxID=1710536 RepID=UPI000E23065B|nr:type II methionyl aminopeptidase [Halorussus litoreus]